MSFILDALKKSETERQQQAGVEFATVPTSVPAPRRNLWLWLLAVLLAVNLAVLLGLLFRPAADVPVAATPAIEPLPAPRLQAAPETRAEPGFAERVANVRQSLPVQRTADEAVSQAGPAAPAAEPGGLAGTRVPAALPERIPTIDELRLEGLIELPELRIDIHVYSDNPADRFVFINMNKQREASLLPAGPLVREIRRDGVVLEHRGRVFLLPRE